MTQGGIENVVHLDYCLVREYPVGTSSVLTGAHAVPVECLSLDISITAYAGTFGNPCGPLHCHTAGDSPSSMAGQNLKSKKANVSPVSGIIILI